MTLVGAVTEVLLAYCLGRQAFGCSEPKAVSSQQFV